ncbi:MAG TPA: hypothetical protein VEM14_01375, partial [Gemmatimonadaceae bacterium]|nr:hypothetical protein [Gemmatimonadaceae bacterium]
MIRATLIAVALAVGALSSEAQNPTPAPTPVPPSGEVKPAQPTPSPKARRTPVVPKVWQSDDLTDLQFKLDALKDLDFDLVTPPIPPIPPVMDFDIDMAPAALAMEHAWDAMPDMDFDFEMPDMPEIPDMPDMPDMPDVAPMLEMTPMPEMAPIPPRPAMPMVPLGAMELTPMPAAIAFSKDAVIARVQGVSPFERQFGGIANSPPESWSQSDPADSLYRLAREALNRGEYRRAAQLFGDITQKFPSSVYATDSRYWKAF